MLVSGIPIETLQKAVRKTVNVTALEYELFRSRRTGRLQQLRERLLSDGIDLSHWTGVYRSHPQTKTCTSHRSRYEMMRDAHGERCSQCGLGSLWNDKYLTLHMDHIDGNKKNNELTNLRFLCPNCHQQTETWGPNQTLSKLPNDETLIEHFKSGMSNKDIATLYSVSNSSVSHRFRLVMRRRGAMSRNDL